MASPEMCKRSIPRMLRVRNQYIEKFLWISQLCLVSDRPKTPQKFSVFGKDVRPLRNPNMLIHWDTRRVGYFRMGSNSIPIK